MFEKKKNAIRIFIYENVMLYPPTINLIECLLNNEYKVHLVAEGVADLPAVIIENEKFSYTEIKAVKNSNIFLRLKKRQIKTKGYRDALKDTLDGDIVWTVNPSVVRTLGKNLLSYSNRHVMQLMELTDKYPLFRGAKILKFNIKYYAQNAWKVVVPEENRAYIQKVGWNLENLPYVLPNKPYYLKSGEIKDDMIPVIEEMKKEKRKKIIYLGVISADRDLQSFAEAIERVKEDYCLYLFGKFRGDGVDEFKKLCNNYSSLKYMGFFNPPKHLEFLKYADIALVPYKPGEIEGNGFTILNALYCAPNKIYEYAGCSIPMIGTDVLGLKEPFEKYNIGVCCKNLKPETIIEAIKYVDANHDQMVVNAKAFYDSVDLDCIVNSIVNE
ncbi:putative uncharacterized protein [Firmicutes bacterium CAG:24]|nr:putative uncharacterized protein [Firmicutes bacterium CAG:24]